MSEYGHSTATWHVDLGKVHKIAHIVMSFPYKSKLFLTDFFGIVFSKGRNRKNVSNQLKFRLEMASIFIQKLSLKEKKIIIRHNI